MSAIRSLPTPVASAPVLFGETAVSALLPWTWAVERLTRAHNYWIVTVRPSGRPHSRPHWCVWLADGLWFTTGSQAVRSLRANPQVSINLEDGNEVLILEGVAEEVSLSDDLQRFVDAYNKKYSHTAQLSDGGIADADGHIGPAFRVRPSAAFGWRRDMGDPTRWTFPAGESDV